MTTTPLRCLIAGRDYAWVPSTREGFHSFCYLTTDDGDHRVAALRPHPERSGWQLLWGSSDASAADGPWIAEHHRYILDARDTVARRLPRYVADHPTPPTP
jgi:hypothetical protein